MRKEIINLKTKDKNILIEKENINVSNYDVKLAIEDIVNDINFSLPINHKIDLSEFCDLMVSIIYKGVITIIEKINGIEIPVENIVFEIC